ncbi:MAG: BatD family protein [Oligoflexia bacterium]|nr:BatD family protein [Oligoflexia bacterium]
MLFSISKRIVFFLNCFAFVVIIIGIFVNVALASRGGFENIIKIETNKDKMFSKGIYEGEGVVTSYYLYSRNKILGFQIEGFPKFNFFYKRFFYEYNKFQKIDETQVIVDGIKYWKKLIYRVQLFPLEEGSAIIDPIRVKIEYINSLFKYQQLTITSEEKKIQINKFLRKDIKENGNIDKIFLLGEHTAKIDLIGYIKEKHKNYNISVGEFIKVEVILDGEGAIELIDPKSIFNLPKGMEFYDIESNFSFAADGFSRREIIYTLILKDLNLITKELDIRVNLNFYSLKKKRLIDISATLKDVNFIINKNNQEIKQVNATSEISRESEPHHVQKGLRYITQLARNNPLSIKILNCLLAFLSIIVLLIVIKNFILKIRFDKSEQCFKYRIRNLEKLVKNSSVKYSDVFQIFIELPKSNNKSNEFNNLNLVKRIKRLNLSEKNEKYFLDLMLTMEKREFNQIACDIPYNKYAFKELLKKYENS